jgi:hypothetical protein
MAWHRAHGVGIGAMNAPRVSPGSDSEMEAQGGDDGGGRASDLVVRELENDEARGLQLVRRHASLARSASET